MSDHTTKQKTPLRGKYVLQMVGKRYDLGEIGPPDRATQSAVIDWS